MHTRIVTRSRSPLQSSTLMPITLTVRREKGKVWSHIRKKWLDETLEERVRQDCLDYTHL